MKIAIAGAGFSGAVLARKLAEEGWNVVVFERRSHVGGHCHTEIDPETGIMLHRYGPHIFHTDNEAVWNFVRRFGPFENYAHVVHATVKGEVYRLPITVQTINQFFRNSFTPKEAEEYITKLRVGDAGSAQNFEERALSLIGRELYDAFFFGYTFKQWGVHPKNVPASTFNRLPLRFNYDQSYFSHKIQALPRNGYTQIIEAMLDHPSIDIELGTTIDIASDRSSFEHCFFTGPIDQFFRYRYGRLYYRTLDFEILRAKGDFQGCAVMNFCDLEVPYTRVTEHKYFAPWVPSPASTVVYREYSRTAEKGDEPFYPAALVNKQDLIERYRTEAVSLANVSFVGRLATYRYIDMDVAIREALNAAELSIQAIRDQRAIPTFFVD